MIGFRHIRGSSQPTTFAAPRAEKVVDRLLVPGRKPSAGAGNFARARHRMPTAPRKGPDVTSDPGPRHPAFQPRPTLRPLRQKGGIADEERYCGGAGGEGLQPPLDRSQQRRRLAIWSSTPASRPANWPIRCSLRRPQLSISLTTSDAAQKRPAANPAGFGRCHVAVEIRDRAGTEPCSGSSGRVIAGYCVFGG